MSNIHAQRLAALRQAMKEQRIDVWIAPSADPHISEYLPEHWRGRTWLSGFDGSVGTLAVSADFAGHFGVDEVEGQRRLPEGILAFQLLAESVGDEVHA